MINEWSMTVSTSRNLKDHLSIKELSLVCRNVLLMKARLVPDGGVKSRVVCTKAMRRGIHRIMQLRSTSLLDLNVQVSMRSLILYPPIFSSYLFIQAV